MKKIVYIFAVLLFVSIKASAQNPQLIIDDCVAPIGGQVTVAVKYNTAGKDISGVNFNIDLPNGLTYELDDKGNVAATMDAANSGFMVVTSKNGFAPFSASAYLAGETGTLLTFVLNVASDLTKDQELTCNVRNIAFTSAEGTKISLDPFTFVVKISDRWILNETSTVAPAATDGAVNVLVKRTINKNQWSTICLPFDLTSEQFYEAFGPDAKLAFFDEDAVEVSPKLGAGEADEIKINFTSDDLSEGFVGNYPYIIKCSKDITEFTFDDVVIAPDEVSSSYTKTISKKKYTYGFYGTYEAGTVLAENTLFLANNKFYYSAGLTKMKAFRCYFNFADVLKDKGNSAKISLAVDGDATSIDGINVQYDVEGVYDLSGRKIQLENGDLNKLQKGVYIIDGKKVTIK